MKVSLDKRTVVPSNQIRFSADSTDTGSGVKQVEITYTKPVSKTRVTYTLRKATDGRFYYDLPITSEFENGIYIVSSIKSIDNAGNTLVNYNSKGDQGTLTPNPDLTSLNFTVQNGADTVKPVLTSAKYSRTTSSSSDIITFTANATDVGTGVKQVTLLYVDPITGGYVQHVLTPQADGSLSFSYKVPTTANPGQYVIARVRVLDKALNFQDYYNTGGKFGTSAPNSDLSALNYTIKDPSIDTTKPFVSGMSFDKNVIKTGESLNFNVTATDAGSGVKSVEVVYTSPISKTEKTFTLSKVSGDNYSKAISLLSTDEYGAYVLAKVKVTDNAGNVYEVFNSTGAYGSSTPAKDLSGFTFNYVK